MPSNGKSKEKSKEKSKDKPKEHKEKSAEKPAEEWNRIRPRFTELYMDGKSLREVLNILEGEGFVAT